MSDLVFVDTNVLVYQRDSSERAKQPRAKKWMDLLWQRRAGRLSTQVLQEYYQTVTRKLSRGLGREDAREEVRDLSAWRPVSISQDVIERAFGLEDRFSLSLWDSLIVAAAQHASCRFLLTEDLQDGQRFDNLVVLDPFRHEPAEAGL
jgi:predicted nucleic acid-binding protein